MYFLKKPQRNKEIKISKINKNGEKYKNTKIPIHQFIKSRVFFLFFHLIFFPNQFISLNLKPKIAHQYGIPSSTITRY